MIAVDPWHWILRLGLAAAIGALIGGERESRGHPAGVRTQSLVALAAALHSEQPMPDTCPGWGIRLNVPDNH